MSGDFCRSLDKFTALHKRKAVLFFMREHNRAFKRILFNKPITEVMMDNIFGTDGIRGVFGAELNCGSAYLLGAALCGADGDSPVVVVGRIPMLMT